jgi:hypothetical protein
MNWKFCLCAKHGSHAPIAIAIDGFVTRDEDGKSSLSRSRNRAERDQADCARIKLIKRLSHKAKRKTTPKSSDTEMPVFDQYRAIADVGPFPIKEGRTL